MCAFPIPTAYKMHCDWLRATGNREALCEPDLAAVALKQNSAVDHFGVISLNFKWKSSHLT